jgi:hypothetical protein
VRPDEGAGGAQIGAGSPELRLGDLRVEVAPLPAHETRALARAEIDDRVGAPGEDVAGGLGAPGPEPEHDGEGSERGAAPHFAPPAMAIGFTTK